MKKNNESGIVLISIAIVIVVILAVLGIAVNVYRNQPKPVSRSADDQTSLSSTVANADAIAVGKAASENLKVGNYQAIYEAGDKDFKKLYVEKNIESTLKQLTPYFQGDISYLSQQQIRPGVLKVDYKVTTDTSEEYIRTWLTKEDGQWKVGDLTTSR